MKKMNDLQDVIEALEENIEAYKFCKTIKEQSDLMLCIIEDATFVEGELKAYLDFDKKERK